MLLMENMKTETTDITTIKKVIDLLLSTDGSTTLALETIVQDTVQLNVIEQEIVEKFSIPKEAKNFFSDKGTFLRRISSLSYKGDLLSENIVFSDLSLLQKEIRGELKVGEIPIGKLIKEIETRRNILFKGYQPSGNILELYDDFSLDSDIFPTKKYQIIRDNNCLFYICEVFHLDNISKFIK
ncbi:chorismate pyruvate-lyase family protein [Bacillus paramycoides]|uniref:chorismate pyruvate-lyase family protein n=1 Tax=Bacillus paramycoides TaxID=2026194 RepID=UPI002E1B3311|nr:chorismate pyruvate-lyase family protein [Bacillus paramycoides]